jgi:hypothetical protein
VTCARALIMAVCTSQVGQPTLEAQDRVITARGCSSCTIAATQRVVFRTGDPRASLSFTPLQTHRDGRGRYFVLVQGQLPLVFSSDGRFLRELGRSGEGPGEFRSATFIASLPGDSLLILDTRLLRASVFSPDLQFVRALALPFHVSAAAPMDWPRRVVVNGFGFTGQDVGWPLHVLDMSGAAVRRLHSFGDNRGELRPGQNAALLRRFVLVGGNAIWAMQVLKYQITRYHADGSIVSTIRRQPDWFSAESQWSLGNPRQPPSPALQAGAIRGDTLWIVARAPRPDWQRAWSGVPIPGVGELAPGRAPEPTRLHMARVEVIDMRSGTLLATRDFDGIIIGIDSGLRATIYDLERGLVPRLRVIELRLSR